MTTLVPVTGWGRGLKVRGKGKYGQVPPFPILPSLSVLGETFLAPRENFIMNISVPLHPLHLVFRLPNT